MKNGEATNTTETAAVAEQGAQNARERASSKKDASQKKGAPNSQKNAKAGAQAAKGAPAKAKATKKATPAKKAPKAKKAAKAEGVGTWSTAACAVTYQCFCSIENGRPTVSASWHSIRFRELSNPLGEYGFLDLCKEMVDTALDSGDYLMRRTLSGVYRIPVLIPEKYDTFNLDLKPDDLDILYRIGIADTSTYMQTELGPWAQVESEIQALQARRAPEEDVEFVLGQFTAHLERETKLRGVRTHIMLPTDRETRIVAYQFNMDNDADQDLELSMDGGCSGKCWSEKQPTYADLVDAADGRHHLVWRMTAAQQAKVKKEQKTMVSIPIFGPGSDQWLIGVLSADSLTAIDVEHDSEEMEKILTIGQSWAVVLTAVLG